MNKTSVEILRNLNLYCYICGLFIVFLGMSVIYMSALTLDVFYSQVGIMVFITGYAFVNISRKVGRILANELQSEKPKKS